MHGLRNASRYRTIWISDLHLGTRGCQADYLLDFLEHTDADCIYLVGDIVDGWRLKRNWYWPDTHNGVIENLLNKARDGTKVVYVPGNHDEGLRQFTGHCFGNVRMAREWIHETADGKRFLVTHGDDFDVIVRYAKWLALLGDWAYHLALFLNHHFNVVRAKLGYPYWSLSKYLKHKVKNAVEYIGRFENALASVARERNLDGVICGHIHNAEIREIDGVLYCNDGDWVESCTALAEHSDGRLELIHWPDAVPYAILEYQRRTGRKPQQVQAAA